MTRLTINGRRYEVPPEQCDEPLLWFLRETLGLVGTRFGCGEAACGACTVMLDDQPVRSCVTPCSAAAGGPVTTIEGLGRPDALHPLQQAWITLRVPQCGFCQAGQLIGAAALLRRVPQPTAGQVREALEPHLCRCGTYDRVVAAVLLAAQTAPPAADPAARP